MKKYFYLFICLFIGTTVWAQKSIKYISFFPISVTQNNVILTQDSDSFSLLNGNTGYNVSSPYHTYNGGLILGATDNAVITVDDMNITDGTFAIGKIMADNILKVISKGKAETVYLGNNCTSGDCNSVSISAANLNIAWNNVVSNTALSLYNVNVNADRLSTIKTIKLKQTNGTYSDFMSLNSGDKLGWVKLRVPGTSTCRKYLVKYTGTKPSDNCNTAKFNNANL